MKSPQFKAWALCIIFLGLGIGGTRAAGTFLEGARLQTLVPGARPDDFLVVVMADSGPSVQAVRDISEKDKFYFTPEMEDGISSTLSKNRTVRVTTSDHSRSRRELDVVLEVWSDDGGTRYGYRASESGVVPLGLARMNGDMLKSAIWIGAKWFFMTLLLIPLGLLGRTKES